MHRFASTNLLCMSITALCCTVTPHTSPPGILACMPMTRGGSTLHFQSPQNADILTDSTGTVFLRSTGCSPSTTVPGFQAPFIDAFKDSTGRITFLRGTGW
eukprot:1159164-Pelagomonas_calceolata.AAC.11